MQKGDQGENGWSLQPGSDATVQYIQEYSVIHVSQEAGFGGCSCEFTGLSRRASEVVLGIFVPKMVVLEDDALLRFGLPKTRSSIPGTLNPDDTASDVFFFLKRMT